MLNAHHRQIVGIWSGNAFPVPTHHTTLVFCESGQGLLYFYYGSEMIFPLLDEFLWKQEEAHTLLIAWQKRRGYIDEREDVLAEELAKSEQEIVELPLIEEEIAFQISEEGQVLMDLGLHQWPFEVPLSYVRKPQTIEEEKLYFEVEIAAITKRLQTPEPIKVQVNSRATKWWQKIMSYLSTRI